MSDDNANLRELTDLDYLHACIAEARAAERDGEVPIGAVIVHNGDIIARGQNRVLRDHDPTAHAEILALRAAARAIGNYRLNGLELFVTLEPCAMCAGAISHARIARLVFGADDTKGGAVLHGPRFFDQPTCHWRPAVTDGVLRDESAALLRGFFKARRG